LGVPVPLPVVAEPLEPLAPLAPPPTLPLVLPAPVLGTVELVPGAVVAEPPVVAPAPAPAPAPARRSRKHCSRFSPTRSRHLLLTSMLASVEPETLPLALLPAPVPVEGDTVPPADAPPLTPDPDEAPVLPDAEPEDWAKAAEDRARSAAAVIAFNIMWVISLKDC
jgi:hypothetical protein